MKKIYSLLLTLAAAGALSASAQQLPNPDFEEAWTACSPWTSSGTKVVGKTPTGWCVSNTYSTMNSGCKELGKQTEGNGGGTAVVLKNVSPISSQVIPAYITLGTTWATAEIKLTSTRNEDGGSWGGYSFSFRPDAVQFDYTHTNGSGSSQPATAVAYLWKGTYTQADVPANNAYNLVSWPTATKTTITNRDRNVLGMQTTLGGTVTHTDGAKLIASVISSIKDTPSAWKTSSIELNYDDTNSTPEFINIIFAAVDYFADRSNHKADDELKIDNVKLLYYSRLASLTINGTSVAGFNSDTYNYTVNSKMPDESAFAFTCMGNSGSGKATLSLDKENAVATITVTNSNAGGEDVDGQTSHVYTINFNKPTTPVQPQLLSLTINGISVNGFDPATYHYVIDSEMPDESAFAFTVPDGFEAKIALDKVTAIATITVSKMASRAETSQTTAVYTLQFNKGEIVIGDDFYGIYGGIVTVKATEAGLSDTDVKRHGNVHIINNGKNDGTCDFKLPDFALDDTTEGYIGDIVVENMSVANSSDGGYLISGSVNPLKLTMGGMEIVAKVTVSGTIDTDGKAVMRIDVVWLMEPETDPEGTENGVSIPVEFEGSKKTLYDGNVYKGTVTINAVEAMLGNEDIVRDGEVHIIPDKNDSSKCTFVLPDFALSGDADGYIGDIVVPGLTVTENGSTTIYKGTVNPLTLTMGEMEIAAKVTVSGTVDAAGKAVMDIDVIWLQDPENDPEGTESGVSIPVKFNGQFDAVAGITDVPVDNTNAPVEYYDLKGNRIGTGNLTPGIYIRRQGTDVQKILVK